jgi:hypothetical protein
VSCPSDSALLTTDAKVSLFTAGFKISNFTIHEISRETLFADRVRAFLIVQVYKVDTTALFPDSFQIANLQKWFPNFFNEKRFNHSYSPFLINLSLIITLFTRA